MRICKKCVLDTTVTDIVFDNDGICNYCHSYDAVRMTLPQGNDRKQALDEIVTRIKKDGRGNKYDCLIGMSGGTDSTYLAYLIVQMGLRPLAVHVDTGWNTTIANNNIDNAVKTLGLDIIKYKIDWDEMASLQLAYFKASVPDCDVPQDHAFPAVLNKIAKKNSIKHLISGHNIETEFILPKTWVYDSNDLENLLDINNKFGVKKLSKYPTLSLFERTVYYRLIKKFQYHRFFNFIEFNKDEAKAFIIDNLGWRDYGGKHYESRLTKFFQAYYLPEKFGFDKRKAHYSNLILSHQLKREEALNLLKKPLYERVALEADMAFILNKLNINQKDWDDIMKTPKRQHEDFKQDKNLIWFKLSKTISRCLKKVR